MGVSAFDVIGPAMIGPSSSHTAGAARMGLFARELLGSNPQAARVELHGSFAATGRGHATDRAIAAGLMGFAPDDERIKDALEIAAADGLDIAFDEADLGEDAHPNTARINLRSGDRFHRLTGASTGGGNIRITDLDGYPTDLGGTLETLVIWHRDSAGFLAKVTAVLASAEINIATIRTGRHARGREALTTLETDGTPPDDALSLLARIDATRRLHLVHRLP